MKVQTLTAVVGNLACNAKCPYCVSKMTPDCGMKDTGVETINIRNFNIACRFAKQNGVSTVLLTGKGEPTLFPEQITQYVRHCHQNEFSFIEIQTNGIMFVKQQEKFRQYLMNWYELGMTTISISIAHYNEKRNTEIFTPDVIGSYNFWNIVDILHEVGFSVRISCTMLKGYVDSGEEVISLVDACKAHDVEQVTARGVAKPEETEDKEVSKWVEEHQVENIENSVCDFLELRGAHKVLVLPHGAIVYDFNGQNICVNNCLTTDTNPDNIRQLIYFPDGHLRYDWKYEGAILL